MCFAEMYKNLRKTFIVLALAVIIGMLSTPLSLCSVVGRLVVDFGAHFGVHSGMNDDVDEIHLHVYCQPLTNTFKPAMVSFCTLQVACVL